MAAAKDPEFGVALVIAFIVAVLLGGVSLIVTPFFLDGLKCLLSSFGVAIVSGMLTFIGVVWKS